MMMSSFSSQKLTLCSSGNGNTANFVFLLKTRYAGFPAGFQWVSGWFLAGFRRVSIWSIIDGPQGINYFLIGKLPNLLLLTLSLYSLLTNDVPYFGCNARQCRSSSSRSFMGQGVSNRRYWTPVSSKCASVWKIWLHNWFYK